MHKSKLVAAFVLSTALLASCNTTTTPDNTAPGPKPAVDVTKVPDTDSLKAPMALTVGTAVDGLIAGQDRDVDYYAFDAVAGDKFRLTVTAPAGSTLDPYVQVWMPDGRTILEKDDDSGAGLNSDLRFNVVTPGRYIITVTSFDIAREADAKDNKATNLYRLNLARR
ncbi:PPC domain-containing protein [Deinococcus lacus]|uniref:PPC domain-containing protein n=1 Tax=Deinococcus lacus TaxID=392561 RepID=A0ABW1YD95_9DEIO